MTDSPMEDKDAARGGLEVSFSPELTNAELIEAGRDLIERAKERFSAGRGKTSGRKLARELGKFYDTLFLELFRHIGVQRERMGKKPPGPICLLALGGYGRGELCFHSDIDLMFLMETDTSEQDDFIRDVVQVMFDWRLEVGHSVRSLTVCLEMIGVDLQSVTAMTESRLLAGSNPLFQRFQETFFRALRGGGRRWFLTQRLTEWRARHAKFDDSIYLLEPNLKEGVGGLRDLHVVQWILTLLNGESDLEDLERAGCCNEEDLRALRRSVDYVFELRNELHLISPRRTDVLNFESQIEITRARNRRGTTGLLPEEVLMREFYGHARIIAKTCRKAFFYLLRGEKSAIGSMLGSLKRKRVDRRLSSMDGVVFLGEKHADYLAEDSRRIVALFAQARALDLRVSERTREGIERIVPDLPEGFADDPENHKRLIEILSADIGVAQTLADMHDCRLLTALIPEFENVNCMVRMDYYHRYTVDEHLIRSVEMFERLTHDPEPTLVFAGEIARQIERPDLLNLALLLHDVGKGQGSGHALRGGGIIQRVGGRLGYEPEDVETLRFLVLSHLKFSHISQRRDLEDPEEARRLAEEVGTLERLKLLYVHSVCDLLAVSPDAMTEWKAQLYERCFRVTSRALEGAAESADEPAQALDALRDSVWSHLQEAAGDGGADASAEVLSKAKLESFIESVPAGYLRKNRVGDIARHYKMLNELDDKTRVQWSLIAEPGLTELEVCAWDEPGTFANVCGALALKDINILSAEVFSTLDGYVIDKFQVSDLENKPLPHGFRLERLKGDLNKVLLGEKTLEELKPKYRTSGARRSAAPIDRPTEIRVDNESSQHYTIVEIRTADRPGLLHGIAMVFGERKLNIYLALLSTEAYGVVDVFYVTDLEYNKLYDDAVIAKLEESLRAELELPRAGDLEAASVGR